MNNPISLSVNMMEVDNSAHSVYFNVYYVLLCLGNLFLCFQDLSAYLNVPENQNLHIVRHPVLS